MRRIDHRRVGFSVLMLMAVLVAGSVSRADELPIDPVRIQRALEREGTALTRRAQAPAPFDVTSLVRLERAREVTPNQKPDSVWEGTLIGAAIGGVGGFVWARQICGADDSECFAIAGPVGILGGAGIGALVGAIADKLHK